MIGQKVRWGKRAEEEAEGEYSRISTQLKINPGRLQQLCSQRSPKIGQRGTGDTRQKFFSETAKIETRNTHLLLAPSSFFHFRPHTRQKSIAGKEKGEGRTGFLSTHRPDGKRKKRLPEGVFTPLVLFSSSTRP